MSCKINRDKFYYTNCGTNVIILVQDAITRHRSLQFIYYFYLQRCLTSSSYLIFFFFVYPIFDRTFFPIKQFNEHSIHSFQPIYLYNKIFCILCFERCISITSVAQLYLYHIPYRPLYPFRHITVYRIIIQTIILLMKNIYTQLFVVRFIYIQKLFVH